MSEYETVFRGILCAVRKADVAFSTPSKLITRDAYIEAFIRDGERKVFNIVDCCHDLVF